MKVISIIWILAIGFVLSCCATDRLDHHVLKLDQPYNHVIGNPYQWALQQFSDGPISGPDVSDYARVVLAYGLKQASADLEGDGTQELILRQDCPARMWEVLVFTPVKGGYRYLGHFPASSIVPAADRLSVLVYEPCGGHLGFIKTYRHDGHRFVCSSTEEISVGDGAPDQNNQRLNHLFSEDRIVKWTKTPNQASAATSKPAPGGASSSPQD